MPAPTIDIYLCREETNQTVGPEKEVQQTDKIYRPRAVPDDACVDFPGLMVAGDQVRKVERRIVTD